MLKSVWTINYETASDFIKRWHYSKRVPTGMNIFFGFFIDGEKYSLPTDLFGNALYAVACYGTGVNPYQAKSLSELCHTKIESRQLVELKRLCRIEPKLSEYPLTAFLSRCHSELKRMGYQFVVSFSDPAHGHNGGIYKAANFQYLGKTESERHAVESDGTIRHRRLYFRYARRHDISMSQAREELGLEIVKTVPKDRWLLRIR